MGLDIIPREYACVRAGTAVYDEDVRIDCKKTQEQDLCPWKSQLQLANITTQPVLGMFGTDCWYRGKYAEGITEEYEDRPYSFYGEVQGEDEDGNEDLGLNPEQCNEFSEWMEMIIAEEEEYLLQVEDDEWQVKDDWVYIAWWLKFVANNCNGYFSWY